MAMNECMTSDPLVDALKMALLHREFDGNLIHHSDRGSQYASDDFQKILSENRIR